MIARIFELDWFSCSLCLGAELEYCVLGTCENNLKHLDAHQMIFHITLNKTNKNTSKEHYTVNSDMIQFNLNLCSLYQITKDHFFLFY